MQLFEQKYRAPEIYGENWFNSEPILLSANRGSVICICFFDFADQGSIRILPYLKEWYNRYKHFGMIFIGLHSPKFPFSKDFNFVENLIKNYKLDFPIVTDNEHYLRGIFKVRFIPTVMLIDRAGYIRYLQEGEGYYYNLEIAIQTLLIDAGYRGDLPEILEPLREEDRQGIQCYRCTPEILVGYQRGSIGNVEGYFPQSVYYYQDPGIYLEGRVYLSGMWFVNKYFIKPEKNIQGNNYLVVLYRAKEVNAVLGSENNHDVKIFVKQDNNYLTEDTAGADIAIDNEKRSFLIVKESRLYNLVINPEFGEHIISLIPESDLLKFYSMSFVTAPISELISGQ